MRINIFILKHLLMDWIWGVTRKKKSRVTKIFGVDNLKNRVAIWRRKQVWKEI